MYRFQSLESKQEELLGILCNFIDNTLISASHEKKGVAMVIIKCNIHMRISFDNDEIFYFILTHFFFVLEIILKIKISESTSIFFSIKLISSKIRNIFPYIRVTF